MIPGHAHLLTHRALALHAALLGDLRCRIKGGTELVETFAHHLSTGGQWDRISLTRRCRCQQTLLLPDITILLGSELSVVETLLKLLPLKLVGIGRHNLIALALMEAARAELPNPRVTGLTLRFRYSTAFILPLLILVFAEGIIALAFGDRAVFKLL